MAQTAVFSAGSVTYSATYTVESAGKFLVEYRPGGRIYAREKISTAGIDGQATKKFGYRGRKITLVVCYVDSSGDAVTTAMLADEANLTSTVGTLVLAGTTYHGCVVEDGAFEMTQPKTTGLPSGLFYATATIVVSAWRLS